MSTPSLFPEAGSQPSLRPMGEKLYRLAQQGVWIGTSSWKYEGWFGQVYTRERYFVRGRYSQRKFLDECLAEYAETFPIVGCDFSFYQFPSPAYWRKLFSSAPPTLRYGLKVPEEITAKIYPSHDRYGSRAGQVNDNFLNVQLFQDAFLQPLEPYRNQVAVLIFEFGTFSKKAYPSVEPFVEDLDRFLGALPRGWAYSVEIRNPEFLEPVYFQCLREHGVAHVFNAWTRMPELVTQLGLPGSFTANFTVCRALLKRGRSYEQAVRMFEPYDRIQEVVPQARQGLLQLIRRALAQSKPAYIFVNNRLEGNAPGTIQAVLEALEAGRESPSPGPEEGFC